MLHICYYRGPASGDRFGLLWTPYPSTFLFSLYVEKLIIKIIAERPSSLGINKQNKRKSKKDVNYNRCQFKDAKCKNGDDLYPMQGKYDRFQGLVNFLFWKTLSKLYKPFA
ncbi:hypothetical protein BDC45DRAFT_534516 [Circinella umbellata]|nr:hypothetical protein BDC45DRAFT_534516 [Circinella umbellata]